MATLKQRVHRMNESGSYDTIYYETSSEVVVRPDGTTVEQTIQNGLGNNTLLFEGVNVPASLWTTSTNNDYAYQATITGLTGVTVNHYPQIVFSASDISSYGLSQEVVSGNSSVTIYADTKPTSAITIITASFTTMNPGNNITLDSTPTQNSVNAVTSNGIYNAISELAETAGNPANLWVWERFNYTPQNYSLDTSISNQVLSDNTSGNSGVNITVQYSSNIEVAKDGTVQLSGTISTLTISQDNANAATTSLRGKYCKYSTNTIGTIPSNVKNSVFFLPNNATIIYDYYRYSSSSPYYYRLKASSIQFVTGTAETKVHDSFVCSIDGNTYPTDGQSGDYWYTRLGQIGQGMTKIETGSYVGTGTSGSSNPNSLEFAFEPKFVYIQPTSFLNAIASTIPSITWVEPSTGAPNGTYVTNSSYSSQTYVIFSRVGNTVSWYTNTSYADYQLNTQNATYNYIAIG